MKKTLRFYCFAAIGILFILLFSCSMKRESIGSHNKIIVVADSTVWAAVQDELKAALERITYTPQPEPIFTLLQKNPDELNRITRLPNILILGELQSQGEMKKLLDKLLSKESVARIEKDEAFLFQKKDAWALDQMLAVMASRDVETLKKNILEQSDKIFDVFDAFNESKTFRTIFSQLEQKDLESTLMSEHGWSVRVPHDYHVAVDSSELRYVWLRRFSPQRWFSAYWEQVDDPSVLSKEWLLQKRAAFVKEFYDGDYVYQDTLITVREKVVDFDGRYAIRLDGVWQNDKHVMGGPFRTYGFYNESDARIYLLDI
ncbi:hypothetical protein DRI50_06575, partial [candidate division KSB1 bacterium]